MKRRRRRMLSIVLPVLLATTATVMAQGSGPFVLQPWRVAGGGGDARGGDFVLTATIGQPEAGAMAGGGFTLSTGLWPSAPVMFQASHNLFLPIIHK